MRHDKRFWHGGMILASLLIAGMVPVSARACAPVTFSGKPVRIAQETAVIVWNPIGKREDFIRQATFDTPTRDLGFLVPTPGLPALAEARSEAFSHLLALMQPEVQKRTHYGIRWTSWLFPGFESPQEERLHSKSVLLSSSTSRPVQLLQSVQVAGYDAVVLKADDTAALAQWLKAHGYEARPAVMAWLAPYVTQHWFVTAFKIAKPNTYLPDVSSAVVRMSFTTDRPVFPYREPADQREAGKTYLPRLLRVFLLSAERMDGVLGASGTWPGQVKWASPLEEQQQAGLAEELALPPNKIPTVPWLTVFEDNSSPRPGTDDVYFVPASSQNRLLPPPLIETRDDWITVPVELALFAVLGVWLIGAIGYGRQRRIRRLSTPSG